MLPELPFKERTERIAQTAFGGLDRRLGAGDGAICDMTNLCSDHAPVLASRPARYVTGTVTKPNGIFSDGVHLLACDGTALSVDGAGVGTLTDTAKVFAALGERVVIWPDKVLWTAEGGLEALGASVTASCTFTDGTYAGETAEANTIRAASSTFDWSAYFRVGDGVTISGAADPENNVTLIVREISGRDLRFYENSFTVNATAASVTVAREIPDLDFLCVNDNRVWGCKGDTICCCKLGDPSNWNVFDGLSTDAWRWDTGTAGDFTGCVSYLGYPVFFKEEAIFKVYGSRPANYEAMRSAATGVLTGAHSSLAIAGDTLFYLSRVGFMAYSGGMPSPVGDALARRYTAAVGGSDGAKYYASADFSTGDRTGTELLVFDTAKQLWHREDGLAAARMAWRQGLYAQTAAQTVLLGTPQTVPAGAAAEGDFTRSVTFARTGYTAFPGKYPVRVWLRYEAEALTVEIAYDGGTWETVASGAHSGKYLPVPIRRCDSWQLRLTASGELRLYAVEQEYISSSDSRK